MCDLLTALYFNQHRHRQVIGGFRILHLAGMDSQVFGRKAIVKTDIDRLPVATGASLGIDAPSGRAGQMGAPLMIANL